MKSLVLASAVTLAVLALPRTTQAQEYGSNIGALATTAGWIVLGSPVELTLDITDVVLAANCTATPVWYSVLETIWGAAELVQLTYLMSASSYRNIDQVAPAIAIASPFVAVGLAHIVHALWPLFFHQQVPRGVDVTVQASPQAAMAVATVAL